jgi:hypothetical protein
MAKHEQAYERLGAKVLTLPDVIAQSVGFMGPVGVFAIGGYLESTLASEFKIDPLPAWAWTLLMIGFASTFVTRARRSASSELSDLTKSTA